MNNRNGLIAAGVIAALALIFAIIQSSNLSQSESKLTAVQSTATAQQAVITDQWVKSEATFSGANTQAAATANRAATAQAGALSDAAKAAATAQAKALGDAAKAASTVQAQVLAAASQAAATAEASAVADTKNAAATTQAKAVGDAKNTAATQQAQIVATLQAGATATLGAVVNAADKAQAEAVATSLSAGATAKAQAVASQQAQATATLGAVIAQAATDRADTQMQYHVTDIAVETQIAAINNQLATAQAAATNAVNPTAVPTGGATAISQDNPTAEVSGVPADWKRYIGKGVAIQLPKTYIGSELGSDPKALSKILRALGPDFEAAATLLESNPEILAFVAVNQSTGDTNPSSSVIILSIPLPSTFPIETLLEATINQLPRGSKVLEKAVVQFEGHDAGRMIVETHVGTIISTQLQYYIIANNALYLVGFTGAPAHFDAQLAGFEQSMKTFEILAKPGI